MTMTEYISDNNLEGAYERYTKTSRQWKSRWWAVVEEIFNSSAEWAKKYILDPIKHTLTKIMKKRGRPRQFYLENVMEFQCEVSGCGAYLIQHFDENRKHLWFKVGKADDGKKRLAEHFQKDYKGKAMSGICWGWFPCVDSDHALSIENVLRSHFRRKGYYVDGNDKFPDVTEITAEDWKEINRRVAKVSEGF